MLKIKNKKKIKVAKGGKNQSKGDLGSKPYSKNKS